MKSITLKSLVAALCLAAGGGAFAQANTVYGGIAAINVNSTSPNFTGPFTPPGANLTVGDKTTFSFGYVREIMPNIELEFALGIPPTHDITGVGALAGGGVIARVKQVAPTGFVNYRFGKSGDTFRPFVGVGVNYTKFSPSSTASGDAVSGGPTKIELSDSTGLAAHAGVSYALGGGWSLIGSIAAAKVKTDMKTITGGVIIRKTTVDLRPVVLSVNIGYSF
jgi:outer membrane protein